MTHEPVRLRFFQAMFMPMVGGTVLPEASAPETAAAT